MAFLSVISYPSASLCLRATIGDQALDRLQILDWRSSPWLMSFFLGPAIVQSTSTKPAFQHRLVSCQPHTVQSQFESLKNFPEMQYFKSRSCRNSSTRKTFLSHNNTRTIISIIQVCPPRCSLTAYLTCVNSITTAGPALLLTMRPSTASIIQRLKM